MTINDTTFLTNTTKTVTTTCTTATRPDSHFAYIDLLRTENGRQYGLNIYDNNTNIMNTTNLPPLLSPLFVNDTQNTTLIDLLNQLYQTALEEFHIF